MSSKVVKTRAVLPAHVIKDRVVQRLEQAERALSEAIGIDQVRLVLDVAAAQEVFAKRQQLGEEVIGFARTIKVRALARLGELLQDMDKATGVVGRSKKGLTRGSAGVPRVNEPPTLADLGVSRKVAAIAQRLAGLPTDLRDAIGQGEKTLASALRAHKAASVTPVSLPDGKFRVLYADPPWTYADKADAGSVQSAGAERHYPALTIAQLCDLPIPALCEDNAVLFLWVTSPMLFESAAVIKAWSFVYKASFVWDKVKHNMGHYNSVRHEFLLVCTRGSCQPDVMRLFDSVQSIERTAHSEKPEQFREIIDTLYPHGRRLELFARREVSNWTPYGNELSVAG